jgi:hypothetical protein
MIASKSIYRTNPEPAHSQAESQLQPPAQPSSLPYQGSIQNTFAKLVTKHSNSAFAKFCPMQLRGPCKDVICVIAQDATAII